MTGRMTPVKHYEAVIEAARRLSRAVGRLAFLLVGDGPSRGRLQHVAGDLVDAGVVSFPRRA